MVTRSPAYSAQQIYPLTLGGILILIILLIVNRDHPFVGHDYAYFIPHILDTDLHIRNNGLAIQWYTPSFGGGLPGFPNPQHLQYSIVQLISFFIDPWTAVLVSTAAISLIGYYFFYKFLNEKLELDWRSGTLGAMFFIGNGFYIEHLIAGQLGYQLFPLSAVILYALTSTDSKPIYNAVVIAIVFTLMIYQAGFYLIIILTLSLGMTLPVLHLYKPRLLDLRRLILLVIFSVILSSAMSASKIHASMAFMRHFPREIFDSYDVGLLQSIVGIIAQLLGVMNLGPMLSMMGHNPEIITGVLVNLTGAEYGIWETDTGLSPVLFIFLLFGAVKGVPAICRARIQFTRSQMISITLLVLATWVTSEFALAKGLIYSSTKHLPILRSLHINVRFVSAFMVPLIILAAFQMHRSFLGNRRTAYFLSSTFLMVFFLSSYFFLSGPIHQRFFDAGFSSVTYRNIKSVGRSPVTVIADIDAWQGFSENASSIKPYEPIFGYKLEEFKPEIHLGSVFETDNGYFNMTNPASLVFPEINNTHPFERIRVGEKDKLEAFVQRRQPEWKIPVTQKILNTLSLIALIFTFGVFLIAIVDRMDKAVTNRNFT